MISCPTLATPGRRVTVSLAGSNGGGLKSCGGGGCCDDEDDGAEEGEEEAETRTDSLCRRPRRGREKRAVVVAVAVAVAAAWLAFAAAAVADDGRNATDAKNALLPPLQGDTVAPDVDAASPLRTRAAGMAFFRNDFLPSLFPSGESV